MTGGGGEIRKKHFDFLHSKSYNLKIVNLRYPFMEREKEFVFYLFLIINK